MRSDRGNLDSTYDHRRSAIDQQLESVNSVDRETERRTQRAEDDVVDVDGAGSGEELYELDRDGNGGTAPDHRPRPVQTPEQDRQEKSKRHEEDHIADDVLECHPVRGVPYELGDARKGLMTLAQS